MVAAGVRAARRVDARYHQLVAPPRWVLVDRLATSPYQRVDQGDHEPDDPDHEEDRANDVELDPGHRGRHGVLEDRADGDEDDGGSDTHGAAILDGGPGRPYVTSAGGGLVS